jgi:hypothetical protein
VLSLWWRGSGPGAYTPQWYSHGVFGTLAEAEAEIDRHMDWLARDG